MTSYSDSLLQPSNNSKIQTTIHLNNPLENKQVEYSNLSYREECFNKMNSYSSNLLPPSNNTQIQTTPHLNNPLENKPVEHANLSYHDRIFYYLLEKGMIDATGHLTAKSANITIPALEQRELSRLDELLNTPITIKAEDKSFEISICLKELFTYLKLDSVEIVGGTVFWILGEDYMRKVCKSLEIPDEFITKELLAEYKRKAADIDIRVFGQENLEFFNYKICFFLAQYLPEKFNIYSLTEKADIIKENGFTNYFVTPDEKNHFGIVTFGDRQSVSVDFICVDILKRTNLFKHDCKIVLSDLKQEQYCPTIKPNSESTLGSTLESMIFRLTKVLDAEAMHEINFKGSAMLFCYLTKGWRYVSESIESVLLANFLKSAKFNQLVDIVKDHFPSSNYANAIFCFNTCQFLPGDKDLILNVTNELLPATKPGIIPDSPLELLKAAMRHLNTLSLEQAKLQFKLLTAYFQVFATLSESKEMEVIHTKIKDESFFQIKCNTQPKALYLTLKDDLESALMTLKDHAEDLKTSPLAPIFQELAKHFIHPEQSLNICEIKTGIKAECIKELSITAFELLESNNALLQQTGFYLLCHAGTLANNPNFLMHLFEKLKGVLNNDNSSSNRKTLIYSLFKCWQHVNPEGASKIKLEGFQNFYEEAQTFEADLIKLFCCTFSTFNILSLNVFIFDLWQKNPKTFDFEASCQLIKNLKSTSPSIALKIFRKLSESKDNAENLNAYFDMLVKEFLTNKNTLIAPDFSYLIDIAEELQFANSEWIQKLLEIDSKKGLNLVHKKFPLDSKSNVATIQEKLKLLVQAFTFESTEIALEIRNVLEIYFKGKKVSPKKVKEILEPKYEEFLLWALKDGLKNPKETILFYIKTLNILTIDNALILKTNASLMALFREVLARPEDIKFVKDQLTLISKPNPSQEEMQLYYFIIDVSLKNSNTEIADEFIMKMIKAGSPDSKIWNLASLCLKQYMEKSNITAALLLLNQITKVFPENPIQNDVSIWKEILAFFSEKQILKKLEILTDQSKVLASDDSCLKMAEETVLLLLKNPTLLKNKSFEPVLKLIDAYQLKSKSMINELKNHFKTCKDKKLLESIVKIYLKMNPFPELALLFYPLSFMGSELSNEFLKRYLEIFPLYEGEDIKEFYQDFSLGLLNLLKLKSAKPLDIHSALISIYNKSEICKFGPFEKQNEIDFSFVRSFVAHPSMSNNFENYFHILVKLKLLATDAKKEELAEILQLFFKALPEIDKITSFNIAFQIYIAEFLKVIKTKVPPIQLSPYFDYIKESSKKPILDLNIELALNIIKSCRTSEVEKLSGDFLKFKPKLKKLIDICFVNQELEYIYPLAHLSFFSFKEISYYTGKLSNGDFNLPDIKKYKKPMSDILNFYIKENLGSTLEHQEFQQKNMVHAADVLTAFIFDHNDSDTYFNHIQSVTEHLFCYLNPKEFTIPQGKTPYLSFEKIEYLIASEENKFLMKEKTYNFFLQLTEQFSAKLMKQGLKLTPLMTHTGQTNFGHLSLMCSFPNRREDTMKAALNYCYTTIFLKDDNMRAEFFIQFQELITHAINKGLFLKPEDLFSGLEKNEFTKNGIKLIAFAGLPHFFYGIKPDLISEILLEMIKEIAIFDEVLAFQYYNLYKKIFLNTFIKGEAQAYETKLCISLIKKGVKIVQILDGSLAKILGHNTTNQNSPLVNQSEEESDSEESGEYTSVLGTKENFK